MQAAATAALVLLGAAGGWIWLLLAATFVGGVGNMLAIVGFMVTATSGLPDSEQGLATGLATMTQQVGITMGIPIMSAVVTAAMGTVLQGVIVAILVNAALALAGVLIPDPGERLLNDDRPDPPGPGGVRAAVGCGVTPRSCRARPPADSRTAAATAPDTSGWNTLGTM